MYKITFAYKINRASKSWTHVHSVLQWYSYCKSSILVELFFWKKI